MPELVLPAVRYHRSFVAATVEDPAAFASWVVPVPQPVTDADRFADYVAGLRTDADEAGPRASHLVPQTTLWWVDGDEFLARVGIRHRLNERLRWFGGHIGYWTRPSARRQGHARAAFLASLPWAHDLGIDQALVTCDPDNVASRRIIESVVAERGGHFEREVNGKRLYWVDTR